MTLDHRFLSEITPDDWVITANRRLSNHLLHQFDLKQQAQNQVWITPRIFPLSVCLSVLWERLGKSQLVLDTLSSRWLWQAIIEQYTHQYPLLDYQRTADLAQEAWHYCQQWKIPYSTLENSDFEEVRVFSLWVREYQKKSQENDWCDETLLPGLLMVSLPSLQKHLPRRMYLYGFDTFSPVLKAFFDAISTHTEIIIPPYSIAEAATHKILLNDRNTEFSLLAQWAKKYWLENPKSRIGCIVPELLTDHLNIERAFHEEFKDHYADAVNISGGDSLSNFSLIQTLFILLELLSNQFIQQSKITAFLLSPYLKCAIKNRDQRSILDRELRLFHHEGFSLTGLIDVLNQLSLCPDLLQLFNTINLNYSGHYYPSEWAAMIKNTLVHFGWPGDLNLSNVENQCVSSFQEKLQYYAGLDSILHKQSFQDFIAFIREVISETLIQTQSDQHAPIQVLGLLEASGLYFDQVWITSMNDDTWPRPASPNPFLPIQLQRSLDIPRSSSSHELQYAQRIMRRLINSTPNLIASYSLQQTDEQRELSPSPLIDYFPETTVDQLQLKMPEIPLLRTDLEDWIDDQAPPVKPTESIRGGATILQRQAECPFRAFAEIRLKARPFDEIEMGLSAAERGSLVHLVLADIWREIGNSATLQDLDHETLHHRIESVVSDCVDNTLKDSPGTGKIVQDLEKSRLMNLVHQWLALEKTRPVFSVAAIEKPFALSIGKLNLRLQVDRIDTLQDGSHLIIDYKTGMPSPTSWFGERPDEPQLPLYALYDAERVRGLAFAQIRTQSVKFNGITAETGMLPKVKASPIPWDNQLDQWKINLTALADDFCNGVAVVDPKQYPTTCQYCHLASVCRINERVS